MSIWATPPSIDALNQSGQNTALRSLGIEFTNVGDDYLQGRMPVDQRTIQPYGILHGGASVLLAETLGSVAAQCCIQEPGKVAVGLEVNANHIRAISSGWVTGTAQPLHLGRSTQVWEIRIENEAQQLVCVSRLSIAVTEHRG